MHQFFIYLHGECIIRVLLQFLRFHSLLQTIYDFHPRLNSPHRHFDMLPGLPRSYLLQRHHAQHHRHERHRRDRKRSRRPQPPNVKKDAHHQHAQRHAVNAHDDASMRRRQVPAPHRTHHGEVHSHARLVGKHAEHEDVQPVVHRARAHGAGDGEGRHGEHLHGALFQSTVRVKTGGDVHVEQRAAQHAARHEAGEDGSVGHEHVFAELTCDGTRYGGRPLADEDVHGPLEETLDGPQRQELFVVPYLFDSVADGQSPRFDFFPFRTRDGGGGGVVLVPEKQDDDGSGQ
mmetsp:Transcript_35480/g.76611  ORF Transcript_35480/g.76611 Transcript_35480/m.76611 type:complete len:289 (-) Transcript_35480:929-1795(-)